MTMLGESSVHTHRAPGIVDNWGRLTSAERVTLCLSQAAEAQNLASRAGPETKREYLAIAANWIQLANEIEATIDCLSEP